MPQGWQNAFNAKGKRMGKRGKKIIRGPRSRRSNPKKEKRSPPRRSFLANRPRVVSKKVGRKGNFKFDAWKFKTDIKRKDFNSPQNKARLLEKTKAFRKKFKTTKTRVIIEVGLRRRGKTKIQKISIGRAEFGDVEQRIQDTITHLERSMRGYARQGFRITRIRSVQLQRVTETKKKKRKK